MVKYSIPLLQLIHHFREELSHFIYHNPTFFDVLFISLYTIEQAWLILAIYLYKNSNDFLLIIVSFFALIVITTFSYHKIIMDSRARSLEKNLNAIRNEMNLLIFDYEHLANHHSALSQRTEKASINIPQKSNKLQRGVLQ